MFEYFKERPIMLIAAVLPLLTVPITIWVLAQAPQQPVPTEMTNAPSIDEATLADINSRLDDSERQLAELRAEFATVGSVPEDAAIAAELGGVTKSVSELQAALDGLEEVILEDPVKALQVPLIQAELSDLQQSNQATLQGIRSDIDRVYDITKWTIGALAITVIAGAAVTFVRKPEQSVSST